MPLSPHSKPAGMVRRTERGTRIVTAIAGVLLTIFAGHTALLRLGKSLVSLSYDIPFIFPQSDISDDIRIVYLDKEVNGILDRRSQAALLDKLREGGATTAVYDIIFDQESLEPEIDQEFAAAIRRFRGVDARGNPIPNARHGHVFLACGRETFSSNQVAGEQLLPPTDVLLDAADDFGLVALDDDEYLIRKLSAGSRDEPSLIWKTAQALGADLDEDKRLEIRWMNYSPPPLDSKDRSIAGHIPTFRAQSVLSGEVPDFFHNKIVVIGGEPKVVGDALGKDLFSTPFHRFQFGGKLPLMSGVEVQANGLANLLHKTWLTRSSPRFDLILIIATGILAGVSFTLTRPLMGVIMALCAVLAFGLAGVFSVHFQRVWFPWTVAAFLQIPVALVWGIAAHSYIDRFFRIKLTGEQEALRGAFGKYLSPEMLEQLTAEGFQTNLGGEKIEAAMMFTDIEAFTDMSERVRDPQRIVQILNDYFERTTGHIFSHQGVIIKYLGDAVFAAWGVPRADPDAPLNAVQAAWNVFHSDKLVVEGVEYRTRIGLNFGEVVAGNIGSSRRLDYTLIGDAVNLTARLEGLNKMLGTHILMSGEIRAFLPDQFRIRRVGKFAVLGRQEITVVHELLGPASGEKEPGWIAEYHKAVDALENLDPAKALKIFSSVNASRGPGGDGPSRFFMTCLEKGELIRNGIVEMKEK